MNLAIRVGFQTSSLKKWPLGGNVYSFRMPFLKLNVKILYAIWMLCYKEDNIRCVRITMTCLWTRWRLKSPSLNIVYSAVYSGADQRKHQSSASLAFVRGIHRWPVNSPHKWPVTRKMFPFDDVIMSQMLRLYYWCRLILHTNNPVYLPFAHKMKYMLLCLILQYAVSIWSRAHH